MVYLKVETFIEVLVRPFQKQRPLLVIVRQCDSQAQGLIRGKDMGTYCGLRAPLDSAREGYPENTTKNTV